jgi:hypothetical protein
VVATWNTGIVIITSASSLLQGAATPVLQYWPRLRGIPPRGRGLALSGLPLVPPEPGAHGRHMRYPYRALKIRGATMKNGTRCSPIFNAPIHLRRIMSFGLTGGNLIKPYRLIKFPKLTGPGKIMARDYLTRYSRLQHLFGLFKYSRV